MVNRKSSGFIHIPFCLSKCPYCDFYSYPADSQEIESYTVALVLRIRALKDQIRGYEIDSVYFGGGTPTVLECDKLCNILSALSAYNISKKAEITLEANPGTITPEALLSLRCAGFNRISIGMQSAENSELLFIGRAHTAAQAKTAVAAARKAGFDNISIDLMLGLPGQTRKSLEKSIAAAQEAEHISAYILKLEPGTPMFEKYPDGTMGEDETAELYLYCCERLNAFGFVQYEISNFARPGFASKHNMKYWKLGDYIGLGPGAHSYFKGRRFFFPRDTKTFIAESFLEDAFADAKKEETDTLTEYIMLSLRTADGIAEKELEKLGTAPGPAMALLEKYEKAGYAKRTSGGFRLTPKGFLISNTIISDILLAV